MSAVFTEQWYQTVVQKHAGGGVDGHADGFAVIGDTHSPSKKSAARLSRQPVANPAPPPFDGYRSALEQRYARKLEEEKLAGTIAGWRYEPCHFRLPGKRNWYKIDFIFWDKQITLVEVKGWSPSLDRSLVKLKTAAGLNPWARWIQVTWTDGQWKERVII